MQESLSKWTSFCRQYFVYRKRPLDLNFIGYEIKFSRVYPHDVATEICCSTMPTHPFEA